MIGEVLGSYRILSQLGSGGMGAVYLAEHRHLGRKAAIKVLLKEFVSRPDLLDRFFAEARATSMIEDPGIVRIFDCEVDPEGRPYIVMEYIPGESLSATLKRTGALPWAEATAYARRMAEALATAHDKGIIHRDIKPDNVFVSPGPPAAIKFVDFGIAKLFGEFHAGQRSRTQTGTVMGTPLYMSPEQCRGAGAVDYRTDIYSLGCVFFEMLCGRPPFQYEGAGELVVAHLTQTPPRARDENPQVPEEVNAIVASMLSKIPAERPQTMRDVAERLGRLVGTGADFPAVKPAPAPARAATPVPPPARAATPHAGTMSTAQTTLSDSATERFDEDPGDVAVPRRRTGLVVAALLMAGGAAAAIALSRGALTWPGSNATPPGKNTTAAPPTGIVEARAPTPIPPPAVVEAPAPPGRTAELQRVGEQAALGNKTPPPAPSRRRAGEGQAPRRAPGTPMRLLIESQPSDAQVCQSGTRLLLGKTPYHIQLPADGQVRAFEVYFPGYRPEKVKVRADRDVTKTVRLKPAGLDELLPSACIPQY